MKEKLTYHISASIVIFKENIDILSQTIQSFLACTFPKILYIIDNSPSNTYEANFKHPDIHYIFNDANIGFAAGHNKVLQNNRLTSDFHLILNPDVTFEPSVMDYLVAEFQSDPKLDLLAPRVIYPNGKIQYTARRYPSLLELMIRTVPIVASLCPKIVSRGQYGDKNLKLSFEPDFFHGCFLFFKSEVFADLKGFDERYFLYMEDVDVCKKLDRIKGLKRYCPQVSIVHQHRAGSKKQFKLFIIHMYSAYKYFIKWGFSGKKR